MQSFSKLFQNLLESSKLEQVAITIYLSSGRITGIVSQAGPEGIVVRTEEGKQAYIIVEKIEAIVIG